MTLRNGSLVAPTWTCSAPIFGAGIGSVGSTSASQSASAAKRRVDVSPQLFASGEGSHVVLGRQPPTHFQTLANRRGIALRHRVERRRMVRGRLFEHDMKIDRGDRLGVRDFDLDDMDASGTKPVQGFLKPAADVVVEHVAEVRPRHGESKSGRHGLRQRLGCEVTCEHAEHGPRIGHRPGERSNMIE
jgi:hypothetical protein